MGNFSSSFEHYTADQYFAKAIASSQSKIKSEQIIVDGLDGAGISTTFTNIFSAFDGYGEWKSYLPESGIIKFRNNMYDVDIPSKYPKNSKKGYLNQLVQKARGVIFVVDSHDREKIRTARAQLRKLLQNDHLRTAALLVFANKQDLPNAMSTLEIAARLRLLKIEGRQWHVQAASGTTGQGLYEGLDWICNVISNNKI